MRNMVNNIAITLGQTRHCGDHFIMYINVISLCTIPETNTILYFNYISI